LKAILDAQTFSRAANALERRFLAIVREAGIPTPETQRHRPDHVREVLVDAFSHLHDHRPLSSPR
jgi:hypothetical protein